MSDKEFKRKCSACNTIFCFDKKDVIEKINPVNFNGGTEHKILGENPEFSGMNVYIVEFKSKKFIINVRFKLVKCPCCGEENVLSEKKEDIIRSYEDVSVSYDYYNPLF